MITGDETTWKKSSTYQGSFYNQILDMPSLGIPILCSHAVYVPQITATTYVYGKCGVDGGARVKTLNLFIGEASWSVSDFQQYLAEQYAAGTPVTIIYQLATPTEETITAPPLMLAKGVNVIDVDTEVKPSSMSITGQIK